MRHLDDGFCAMFEPANSNSVTRNSPNPLHLHHVDSGHVVS
jgi:hypothetical protein